MITRLRLKRFKNFKDAELRLGPFTLLVGTNASGKSNLRDAFRFLHGIGRGYTLAEIMGEKYVEGGVLQWRGIRGGTREAAFDGTKTFAFETSFRFHATSLQPLRFRYRLEVDPGQDGKPPRVIAEHLSFADGTVIYDSHPKGKKPVQGDPNHLSVLIRRHPGKDLVGELSKASFLSQKPVLSQLTESIKYPFGETSEMFGQMVEAIVERNLDLYTMAAVPSILEDLASMRFLDLNPEAMRLPSFPGQTILGDRGENLSSVLQSICEDPQRKATLVDWLRELTPMDVSDFEFPADQVGRILVALVEGNGRKTSVYSASDGTLRFLAMIAALLGPDPARFYFIEELDNGIHPTRLHLLLQLIEQKVSEGKIQMVATTHSPQLLSLVSRNTLENASLVYRLPNHPEANIKRILDLPEGKRVIKEQDVSRLHESGWLEDAVAFSEDAEAAT